MSTVSLTTLVRGIARTRQELLWVSLGQLATFLGGVVSIKIIAPLLGPGAYGEFALGLAIAGTLTMLVYGPVSQYVLRYYVVCVEREELPDYFRLLKKTHLWITLTLLGLGVVAVGWVSYVVGKWWGLLVALSLVFAVATGLNSSVTSLQNAKRKRASVARFQASEAVLRPIGAGLLIGLIAPSSSMALLGFIAASILAGALLLVITFREADTKRFWNARPDDRESNADRRLAEFSSYSAPFLIFGLVGVIGTYGDRWLLQGWLGTREVGIYVAMYQIANAPLTLLLTIMNNYAFPIVFSHGRDGSDKGWHSGSARELYHLFVLASVAIVSATGVAYLFSEPIVRVLTDESFTTHHDALWILVLGLAFFHIGQQLTLKGFYLRSPKFYILPKACQAMSFLGFAFLFGKQNGITGVAVALCLSTAIYLLTVVIANAILGRRE